MRDSISETLSVLDEIIRDLPPASRSRAGASAKLIERAVNEARRRYPKDIASLAGTAWAIYKTAEKLVDAERNGSQSGQGLIQLLN